MSNDHMTPSRMSEIQARATEESKALRICARNSPCPHKCPRYKLKISGGECARQLMERSAESLETQSDLLAEISRLTASLAAVTRERDAAARDLKWLSNEYKFCVTCKRDNGRGVWDCNDERCDAENHYEWRGLCALHGDEKGV